jgi:DNA-directed RNA polymerase specialized sigma24 family protein
MKLPTNMTEAEVVQTILEVTKRLSSSFTFAYFDKEDIEQEAFLMGMEALDRYDEARPLENFLFIHIKNRLKNFKRDKYYRYDEGKAQKIQQNKKNLLDPLNIDVLPLSYRDNKDEERDIEEIYNIIDRNLPNTMRNDYLRIKSGVQVNKNKRIEVIEEIQRILEEVLNEEG